MTNDGGVRIALSPAHWELCESHSVHNVGELVAEVETTSIISHDITRVDGARLSLTADAYGVQLPPFPLP